MRLLLPFGPTLLVNGCCLEPDVKKRRFSRVQECVFEELIFGKTRNLKRVEKMPSQKMTEKREREWRKREREKEKRGNGVQRTHHEHELNIFPPFSSGFLQPLGSLTKSEVFPSSLSCWRRISEEELPLSNNF